MKKIFILILIGFMSMCLYSQIDSTIVIKNKLSLEENYKKSMDFLIQYYKPNEPLTERITKIEEFKRKKVITLIGDQYNFVNFKFIIKIKNKKVNIKITYNLNVDYFVYDMNKMFNHLRIILIDDESSKKS